MRITKTILIATLLTLCGAATVNAQVMKSVDLEKYAKQRYGDRWLDAAAVIAKDMKWISKTQCRLFSISQCDLA